VDGIRLAIAGWAKAYAEGAIIDYVGGEGTDGFTVTADKKWYEADPNDDW
jgi:hypothetical protein